MNPSKIFSLMLCCTFLNACGNSGSDISTTPEQTPVTPPPAKTSTPTPRVITPPPAAPTQHGATPVTTQAEQTPDSSTPPADLPFHAVLWHGHYDGTPATLTSTQDHEAIKILEFTDSSTATDVLNTVILSRNLDLTESSTNGTEFFEMDALSEDGQSATPMLVSLELHPAIDGAQHTFTITTNPLEVAPALSVKKTRFPKTRAFLRGLKLPKMSCMKKPTGL